MLRRNKAKAKLCKANIIQRLNNASLHVAGARKVETNKAATKL